MNADPKLIGDQVRIRDLEQFLDRGVGIGQREADHAGRLHVGDINKRFLSAGGLVAEYTAAVKAAIDRGYIDLHPSGAYVTFTQAGAELFA